MGLSERDKADVIFHDLTNAEYIQLSVFNKLNQYAKLKTGTLNYSKGYSKYDILWNLYNDVVLENAKKDLTMCSIAYRRMSEQLYREKKYKYALRLLIVALYYHIADFYNYDKNLYERHIKKHHDKLTKYIEHSKLSFSTINELELFFNETIEKYVPNKRQNVLNLLIKKYWEDISIK